MLSADDLEHVDLGALKRRLAGDDWQPFGSKGLFRSPDGRFFSVPDRLASDMDYAALAAVVEALLGSRQISTVRELLSLIAGRKEDVLLIGCEIEGARTGRMPAQHAPTFYRLVTQYMRMTYIALLDQLRYTGRQKENFFKTLAYGETGPGSYLVSIHVPVNTIPDPLGRQLVSKSVAAFESLRTAVVDQTDAPLLEAGESGWSAPMCEALIGFAEYGPFTEVKIQAQPDDVWDVGKKVSNEEIVVPLRGSGAADILASTSAKRRGLVESQYVDVMGIPYASRDDAVIGEGRDRSISIKWLREGQPPLKVRALMSPLAYEVAIKGLSHRQISVSGRLRQSGRRWVLEVDGMPTLLDVMDARPDDLDPFVD